MRSLAATRLLFLPVFAGAEVVTITESSMDAELEQPVRSGPASTSSLHHSAIMCTLPQGVLFVKFYAHAHAY